MSITAARISTELRSSPKPPRGKKTNRTEMAEKSNWEAFKSFSHTTQTWKALSFFMIKKKQQEPSTPVWTLSSPHILWFLETRILSKWTLNEKGAYCVSDIWPLCDLYSDWYKQ